MTSAFVQFEDLESAKIVYAHIKSFAQKAGEISILIGVEWAVDLLEMEDTKWVAVVLRNLPPNCTMDVLYKNCTKTGEKVKYVLPKKSIRGMSDVSFF